MSVKVIVGENLNNPIVLTWRFEVKDQESHYELPSATGVFKVKVR